MKKKFIRLLFILIAIFVSLYYDEFESTYSKTVDGILEVYFLDVGQADAILIRNEEEAMIIDAGNNEDGELLSSYISSLGINNFKYVVGTHPHEDHIGGLDNIINNFDIDTIFLPDVITTTKTFVEVLDTIENKNMMYDVPVMGDEFNLGDANIEVIYTGTDTGDLNNTSIVLRLDYGEVSFLFTGDATDKTEQKIINKNIDVDVLKVGHHGSRYSTTQDFLEKVTPDYAIISVGNNNSYDHPHNETLKKLKNDNIEIHRTDQEGTILITTDGKNLEINNMRTDTNG